MVNCHNHLLKNQIQKMIDNKDEKPGKVVDEVKEIMKKCKNLNKNAAVLRRFTKLRPNFGSKTKWTGWSRMLKSWSKMHKEISEAALEEEADIDIPSSTKNTYATKTLPDQFDVLH
jgi:hypothetical protein